MDAARAKFLLNKFQSAEFSRRRSALEGRISVKEIDCTLCLIDYQASRITELEAECDKLRAAQSDELLGGTGKKGGK